MKTRKLENFKSKRGQQSPQSLYLGEEEESHAPRGLCFQAVLDAQELLPNFGLKMAQAKARIRSSWSCVCQICFTATAGRDLGEKEETRAARGLCFQAVLEAQELLERDVVVSPVLPFVVEPCRGGLVFKAQRLLYHSA